MKESNKLGKSHNKIKKKIFRVILVIWFIFLSKETYTEGRFITTAVTTSTANSGLLNYLIPKFEEKTSINVRVVVQGTGQALETGRRGDVDVVMVHAETLEKKFISDGYGKKRYPFMYNDFILIGPENNPARIKKNDDIYTAFKKIQQTANIFVSRGDKSGTHFKEESIWKKINVKNLKNKDWYLSTGSGMGATINTTVAKNGHSLADRATWISFKNKGEIKILLEGDQTLFNQYGVMLVNPEKHTHIKKIEGEQFINWLVSEDGQKTISSYKINNQQLFFPNAKK